MQPVEKLENISWFPFNDEPLLSKEFIIPAFCDPQVLLPEEAVDKKWHLFVHSWLGLHHYVSDSGIAWEPKNMIEVRSHSPYIYVENNVYYLLYEKHDRKIPLVGQKHSYRDNEKDDDSSRIEICSSTDLATWSRPRILLDSRSVSYSADYNRSPRISRPQLFKVGNNYRLYFGVSHVHLPDTFQKVSRYFSYAESSSIDGLYRPSEKGPLLAPVPDDPFMNLGVGSMRVLQGRTSFRAFQCSAFWDAEEGRSKTAMFILDSDDGLKWKRNSDKPVLFPPESGWASGYIMACDVRYKASENCWYCYYSANRQNKMGITEESVGLLLGQVPELRNLKAARTLSGVMQGYDS
ncbi:MAG: hypothetical protein SO135_05115 [Sphaerochaetaceae bacterium]|jgi:hypothetical protein|nr:hypothetical protein [Sphaerochaetaceae bacterium]